LNLTAPVFHDELVAKCKLGDRQSYSALYARYAQPMYNTSLRIVNNRFDAEDVLQEAFTSAFQYLGDFDYSSTFGAWLKRIVVNRSIDLLRRRKALIVDIEAIEKYAEPNEEPEEDTSQWKIEQVKRSVGGLPTGYRTVITLHLFEGYEYDEIAVMMGISVTTVRTQYHRARKKLLEMIKKEIENEG
jgi:RNA polymerase sigma-70 factor (ECF subfamily)